LSTQCLAMVRGTASCRGCGILHQDDLLLPHRKWHGNVCSICHCMNCSAKDGYKGRLPARESIMDPEFCAASRTRRRLAGVPAGPLPGDRGTLLGPGVQDFSACFYDVDLSTLSVDHLYLYRFDLTGRLRIIGGELRRRVEAGFLVSPFGLVFFVLWSWSC